MGLLKLSTHQNHLVGLINRPLGSHSRVSGSLDWDLRISMFHRFPGDADAGIPFRATGRVTGRCA